MYTSTGQKNTIKNTIDIAGADAKIKFFNTQLYTGDESARLLELQKTITVGLPILPKPSYFCKLCNRFLPIFDGVITHDNVPHPEDLIL